MQNIILGNTSRSLRGKQLNSLVQNAHAAFRCYCQSDSRHKTQKAFIVLSSVDEKHLSFIIVLPHALCVTVTSLPSALLINTSSKLIQILLLSPVSVLCQACQTACQYYSSGLIFYLVIIGRIERVDKQGCVFQGSYLACHTASAWPHVVRVRGMKPCRLLNTDSNIQVFLQGMGDIRKSLKLRNVIQGALWKENKVI